MEKRRLGFALTGSFCTYDKVFPLLRELARDYEVTPIFSAAAAATDSRFGLAQDFMSEAEAICGRPALTTLREVEPIGPKKLLDLLLVAPCTGNTLAKLAAGIADGAVTMACKSQLRNGRPLVLAISTNDGLGAAAENVGRLLARKHVYFVPFGQDDPAGKPTSLVADFSLAPAALAAALRGEQVQPLLLGHRPAAEQGEADAPIRA